MRITQVELGAFLSHRYLHIDIPHTSALTLICGDNGAGKTAVLQGIRLALTGESPRGADTKSGMRQDLVQHGAKPQDSYAQVDLQLKDGTESATIKYSVHACAWVSSTTPQSPGMWQLVLDPSSYAGMTLAQRRALLFKASGVMPKGSKLIETLISEGHGIHRVDAIKDALRTGFDNAALEAKAQASAARALWCSITGASRYGEKIADGWEMQAPELTEHGDPAKMQDQQAQQRKELELELADLQGLRNADLQHATLISAFERHGLRALDDLQSSLQRYRDDLVKAERALEKACGDLEAAKLAGTTQNCPCCDERLQVIAGRIAKYTPPTVMIAMDLAQKVYDEALARRTQLAASVQQTEQGIAAHTSHQRALTQLPPRPAQTLIEAKGVNIARIRSELDERQRMIEAAIEAKGAVKAAAERTAAAKAAHLDVAGFVKLQDVLAEMPGRYLTAALATANGAMAQLRGPIGTTVHIGADLELVYGTIPYALASESQQLRADLAFGYAIAVLTGTRVVALDRFDAISQPRRGPLLQFMAQQKEVQFIVAATQKAKPAMPAAVNVVWLEGGS